MNSLRNLNFSLKDREKNPTPKNEMLFEMKDGPVTFYLRWARCQEKTW